jgi:hypothetical protein
VEKPTPPEVLRSVTCTRCHETQIVRTNGEFGIRFMHTQPVQCIRCTGMFNVILPYEIVGGPYPNK